ncbi:MAG: DUF2264 domain-containing protein [Clostridia bacterium]|nr:DUF2264 domain-containing protein [Clostridia bacterium]
MLHTRQDLMNLAKASYIPLLERAARRYESNEIYLVIDHVGYECTRIEELFRPLWGIAPFLSESDFKITVSGKPIHVCDFITKIILEGTASDSPRRFDRNVTDDTRVSFANQCITEIAAYLVAVHFAKEVLWEPLSAAQKDQIAGWIHQTAMIALKKSWPNNHYWYPVMSIEILRELGYWDPEAEPYLQEAYKALEELYVGNGWYCDGKEFGRFDYYEAWAHQTYTLLWILIADKAAPDYAERCERYKRRTEAYLRLYTHYFDADGGLPAYGRSLSYRFAAVSVFGLAALVGCDMDLGLAKSIILRNIDYFFTQSLPTEDGCFSPGYLYPSMRFAENYASDGATCCYTEGFMCLLAGEDHPLWTAEVKPLHIEKGDYLIECPVEKLDFLLQGEKDYGGVTLFNNAIHYFQTRNYAFNDMCGYYSKFCYNSRAGFALSTRDKPSFDNMITLSTPDKSMTSLRGKIYTVSSTKELLISYHIPFSNDPETRITTWTLPLSKGYHVRIHKVELARPYEIREGGFCIGVTDDSWRYENGRLCYGNAVSSIRVVSDTESKFELQKIHPGMHNLRPMAYYPTWKTKELPKGSYIFATTVFFSTDKIPQEEPRVTLSGNTVTVGFAGKNQTVSV